MRLIIRKTEKVFYMQFLQVIYMLKAIRRINPYRVQPLDE